MGDEQDSRKAAERRAAENRLAEALKANLRRRKEQARARAQDGAGSEPPFASDAPSAKNPLD